MEEGTGSSQSSNWKDTFSTIGIIIMAPIVALFLTAFVFQSYQVDGPSMERTLQDGDRLIVTKAAKTWSRLGGGDYIPKRFDIIIFNQNGEYGEQSDQKQLVKRVIGLPGDRVVIKDGSVTIYNKDNPNGLPIPKQSEGMNVVGTTSGNFQESVDEGEVYVMGDNRENSLDSRAFGSVRAEDIVGKLSLRIYPFSKFDKF